MTLELQAPPVQASVAAAASRLIIPRNQAMSMIRGHLEKGLEIKRLKIRYVPELEKARELKGDWTTAVMTTLKGMFNSDKVADECQNWVGKVLPEYADLNLFIEHFYDEMDQRLRKLHAVLKQVQALPDETARPIVAAPAPAQQNSEVPMVAAVKAPAPAPVARSRNGVMVVCKSEAGAQAAVKDFAMRLGFELCEHPSADLPRKLDEQNKLDFGLILATPDAMPDPFDLGYLVGRLGVGRTFILTSPEDKLTCDPHGLLHIPLDPADGWQLHLARHLKRAGLEIDLNRVF